MIFGSVVTNMNQNATHHYNSYGPCFCGNIYFNIYIGGSHFLKCKCNTSKAKDNCCYLKYFIYII